VDPILRSRIRWSRQVLRCTISASTGHRIHYRYLSIRLSGPEAEDNPLAAANVSLGPSPEKPDRGIIIGFPSTWGKARSKTPTANTTRTLSSYHAREPLVLDLVTMLLQPGHSRTFVESAAAALVCCVLQVENELTPSRRDKVRLRR